LKLLVTIAGHEENPPEVANESDPGKLHFPCLAGCYPVGYLHMLFSLASRSLAEDSVPKPVACGLTDPSLDDTSDIQGVIDYKAAIRQILAEHKFEELDCIADAARAGKSQFAGGRWKLNVLYWATEQPQGHATEEDWAAHLKTLSRWVSVFGIDVAPATLLRSSNN